MRQERAARKQQANWSKPHGVDFVLLVLALALLAFGLVMVESAGAVRGVSRTQDPSPYYYFLQQLKWALAGAGCALIAVKVPYFFWRRVVGVAVLGSIALLSLVLFSPAGIVAKGSARWLNFLGINVQPSEIAKLAIVLFLAHALDRYPVKEIRDAALPGLVIAITLGLIFKQPDLGTTLVLGATCLVMYLQTELPWRWFAAITAPLAVAGAYFVRHADYQWQRIMVWLHPWNYASGLGYQITSAEIAFGSGGLFGVGLGKSLQKYGFLPENHTDMIFAIVGEELGLLGTLLLIGLFVALYARAFMISHQCPDRFGRLLGFGLTSALAIQTAVNLAVVTGVFPVTGITLPLISYGGSSLLITMAQIGVLLNISRYRPLPETPGQRFSEAPAKTRLKV